MTLSDKRYISKVLERTSAHVEDHEGRQTPRHPFQTRIKVTPLAEPGGRVRPYLTRRCPTIDVSQGGLRLLWIGASRPERLLVVFEDKTGAETPIECSVAWWKELTHERIELGLRFVGKYPNAQPMAPANDRTGEETKCSTG